MSKSLLYSGSTPFTLYGVDQWQPGQIMIVTDAVAAQLMAFPGFSLSQYAQKNSGILSAVYTAPALGSGLSLHAAISDTGSTITANTMANQPDVPRTIVATPGGTTANVTAVSVVVNGTDAFGNVLAETLPAFTAGQATAVTGIKAFATVTSLVIPAIGASVTTTYTFGAALGLPVMLTRNTVLAAYRNGVKEVTAPTVVPNSTDISKNTVTLNSALNGTDVIVDYYAGA